MQEKNGKKMVDLIDPVIAKKHNVRLAYVLVECGCGRTFGITPDALNQVPEEKLICYSCLVKKHGLVESEL